MNNQVVNIHISIRRTLSLIACFSLFLILIFGSVSSSSNAYADDMMGMPSPQATTDALTAGGGPDNGDDENDSGDDTGGSQDSDDDKDDEPIPKDAPATSSALTAKKLECPTGQEVTLFSTTCESAGGGANGGESTTSAATVCPTSPTPTSYSTRDELSATSAVRGFNNNDYEIKTEQLGTQTLLHWVATPIRPGLDPGIAAVCTGQSIDIANPDGTKTTYFPDGKKVSYYRDGSWIAYNRDGSKTALTVDANPDPDDPSEPGNIEVTESNTKGQLTKKSVFDMNGKPKADAEYDPISGQLVGAVYYVADGKIGAVMKIDPKTGLQTAIEYDPKTDIQVRTIERAPDHVTYTNYDPKTGKPIETEAFTSDTKTVTTYVPGTDMQATVTDFDRTAINPDTPKMKINYNPNTGLPSSTITYDPTTGKPDMQIKFKEDGVTPDGPALHYDKDGTLKPK